MVTTNFKFAQLQTFQLAGSGVSVGDSSMILTSFNQIDGTPLSMSNFGIIGYGTLEPGSGINEEQISFTSVTDNIDGTVTLGGIKSVLDVYPYTGTANFASDHAGGVAFVISNTAGFYSQFAVLNNDESITGKWTFLTAERPTLTVDLDTAVNTDLITFGQLARTAIAGGVDATQVLQGFVQLATQAQYDAKTLTGSTGAALVATPDLNRATKYNDYVPDTGISTAYVITPSPVISSYTTGQQFTFLAGNTNTSTTPTLNVNALGPKTITNPNGSAISVGQIIANSIVQCVYDGTNMEIQSVPSNSVLPVQTDFTGGTVSGTTSETTISTGITIAANKVGQNSGLRFNFSYLVTGSGGAGSGTWTIRVKFGGVTTITFGLTDYGVTEPQGSATIYMFNQGATNSQKYDGCALLMLNGNNANSIASVTRINGTSSIDFTTSQAITVTAQCSSGTNTALTNGALIVELIN